MAEIYRHFARDFTDYDFNENAAEEMFLFESTGSEVKEENGYFVGKRFMDITVKMWREDIAEGLLYKFELYDSGDYPCWWLDKVIGSCQ